MATHFHPLTVKRFTPDAAGSAAITLAVPPALREAFDFAPGQFLTLRATIEGAQARRSYSICSPRSRYQDRLELDIGIKPVAGGLFSRWALAQLRPGATVDALPPEGRFTPRAAGARHRVGFAAGSGITPILSIVASTLEADPDARFTLVYGNQRVNSIMFNEALADLKDRYPARLSLIHLLSRQPQEVPLFNGRLDAAKVGELLRTVLPAAGIDEAFVCGPEGMIEAVEAALAEAGLAKERIHAERFVSSSPAAAIKSGAAQAIPERLGGQFGLKIAPAHELEVVLDGKTHRIAMAGEEPVLDAALAAGLDLPYSCKGGVCCTCRAKVLEGRVEMARNFTLEAWEVERGFVLTCQARALTERVVVSYDER